MTSGSGCGRGSGRSGRRVCPCIDIRRRRARSGMGRWPSRSSVTRRSSCARRATVFITDPVFTSHAGPFGIAGPRRVRRPGLLPGGLPTGRFRAPQPQSLRPHAALVAGVVRGHADRCAARCWAVSRRWSAKRMPRSSIGGSGRPSATPKITCVPAQHFSARTPWDRNKSLWCGFVVRADGVTVYFAGDSGYSPQFAEIGATLSGRSTSRCSRSAPTSRAGSWRRCT